MLIKAEEGRVWNLAEVPKVSLVALLILNLTSLVNLLPVRLAMVVTAIPTQSLGGVVGPLRLLVVEEEVVVSLIILLANLINGALP